MRVLPGLGPRPRKRVEGRTFELSFPLPGRATSGLKSKNTQGQKQQRKSSTDGRPAKKTAPKARKPKLRAQPTPAEAEARADNRRKYDQNRNQTPERKELHRRVAQARRDEAKALGLCKDCPNPAIPNRARCETCTAKHRHPRRQAKNRAVQQRNEASGQTTFFWK